EALVRERPTPFFRMSLATAHVNFGALYREMGHREKARAAVQRAIALQEKLVREHPTNAEYRQHLALSHTNLGGLYQEMGRRAQAEAALRRAVGIQEKLAGDRPADVKSRQRLAG